MRRKLLSILAVVALVAMAGCTLPWANQTGTGSVYASAHGDAVDDFKHLNVTVTTVGVYRAENGTWMTETTSTQVDLAELEGANATNLANMTLETGRYSRAYLEMDNVEGILENGTEASVEIQSDQIEVQPDFAVSPRTTTTYVFDLHVEGNVDGAYLITSHAATSGPNQPINVTSP